MNTLLHVRRSVVGTLAPFGSIDAPCPVTEGKPTRQDGSVSRLSVAEIDPKRKFAGTGAAEASSFILAGQLCGGRLSNADHRLVLCTISVPD